MLDIYWKETKAYVHMETWKHADVYSSVIHNSLRWKQPQRPLADQWIDRMWYIHMLEYYSIIKVNACSNMDKPWKNYVKQKSPSHGIAYYMTPLIENFLNRHIYKDKK